MGGVGSGRYNRAASRSKLLVLLRAKEISELRAIVQRPRDELMEALRLTKSVAARNPGFEMHTTDYGIEVKFH